MKEIEAVKNNDFKFNKKFGQNFIFDKNLLNAIVNDSKITNIDEVLEIGPGAGTLTKIIASHAKRVICYEIDTSLKPILDENLKDVSNVKVIFEDALKSPIINIEKNFEDNYSIIANIPYYITTPLILKFIKQSKRVNSMTIMVQKEVAERLTSLAGANYGAISVILDFYGEVKLLRQVPRHMFIPSPKVDSSVIQIKVIKNKYDVNSDMFERVVKSAFSNKRKTLANNLSKDFKLSKEKIVDILLSLNFDGNVRGDSLKTLDFVSITKKLLNI